VGSVVAMLLYNGSDSCVSAAESLLVQSVQVLYHHFTEIFASGSQPQQAIVAEHQHLDNAFVEQILLRMKEARNMHDCTSI
jgi:hypothetical protein